MYLKDTLLDPLQWSKLTFVLVALVGYVCLVRLLRWRYYNALHKKWAGRNIDSITPEEAQQIMLLSYMYDLPGLEVNALSFALFKTYAIPSISKILANTKEFSTKDLVSRRFMDTEILIGTWMLCPMSGRFDINEDFDKTEADPRAMIALARVNWLHSHYPISNDDYLYTLSLFILEPIKWSAEYGWRALSLLECQAHFIYWKEIGNRMNIKDIPETFDELVQWSTAFEEENMIPAISNHKVAEFTINELLHAVPTAFGIKAFAQRIVVCLLEERVRISMMQPAQPKLLVAFTRCLVRASGYFQRYLCLPRFSPESLVELGPPKTSGPMPRMHPTRWRAKPWYKPESTGLNALLDTFAVMIGYHDCLPGREFRSEGYRLEELGPLSKKDMAHEEIMRNAAELQGCPVTGPWSLEKRH